MNKSYDLHEAEALIPLLSVVNREIHERMQEIKALKREVKKLKESAELGAKARRIQEGHLLASISNHKLEVRLAQREISRLGCFFDEEDPSTVHIPGENGDLDAGFTWRVGEAEIRELLPE